ncbi:hypothetical protein [Fredinandcohnia sp. 179-A 10B2 NHS]|uniref:hypothetical protein n=1 Tax=Fredinandcohnia sp. 179-A 10B2 NHS TaxID=3235176 RepID=UPI00399EF2FD
MPYQSKIRASNPDRVTRNTTVSQALLDKIKLLAKNKQISFNQLLADGIDYVLKTYKKTADFKAPDKPNDRVQMGTTFSENQYNQLKNRARSLRTHTNTLLEVGMEYVINKHKN